MNNKFNKGIEETKEIRMTKSEKDLLLNKIIDQATDHARLGGEIKSAIKSPYNFIPAFAWMKSNRFYSIVAALVIVGLMGNGIAIAAENSLPGDTLYPIKVNVVEPVKVALAKTPVEKARVHVDIATKRLQEAEVLAEQNKLDEQKTEQISRALDKQAKVVEAAILAVSSSTGTTSETGSKNSEIAADIETDFQASMSAHAKILDGIANEKANKKNRLASVSAVSAFSASISTSTDEHGALSLARNARSKSEKKAVSMSTNDVQAKNVEKFNNNKKRVQKVVTDTIKDIQTSAGNVDSLDVNTVDNVKQTVSDAEAHIEEANKQIENGEETDATQSLRESEKAIKEAKILFKEGIKKAESRSAERRKNNNED